MIIGLIVSRHLEWVMIILYIDFIGIVLIVFCRHWLIWEYDVAASCRSPEAWNHCECGNHPHTWPQVFMLVKYSKIPRFMGC